MIIEKVLNNNAAQVLDDDGRSYVITGSGVAFQKKQG
ncbi:CAT RNA binding domain-containing protein, partial [Jeotgalibaca porci]